MEDVPKERGLVSSQFEGSRMRCQKWLDRDVTMDSDR